MPSLRQIRLATGLVLYVYVTLHFVNHALGNISVDAMESGLAVQKLIWQSLAGATILYVSLLTHMSLGFWRSTSGADSAGRDSRRPNSSLASPFRSC